MVGLVNRSVPDLPEELRSYPLRHDYLQALEEFKPDVASIALASGAVKQPEAPGRFRRNMPDPIPVACLAASPLLSPIEGDLNSALNP